MVKHGMRGTKIYGVYASIKSRCNNENTKYYHLYGGRGIKCEWEKFEDFYRDMGDSYKQGLHIDRIDNGGNYCKENCRWITPKQNSGNRRTSIIYKGKCLKHWCEELGVNKDTIRSRIKNGWDIKEAIFTPIGKTGHSIRK